MKAEKYSTVLPLIKMAPCQTLEFNLLGNLICSVAVIVLNKWIYAIYNVPNLFLTCLHLIFTSIGLFVCERLDIFRRKSLPIRKILSLTILYCGCIVFTNLSLQYNTVTTYQITKTLTTPLIIALQFFFIRHQISSDMKAAAV